MKNLSKGPASNDYENVLECNVVVPAFLQDFRVVDSTDPTRIVATNVSCPDDQPEIVTITQRVVANVYAGTDVPTSAMAASRKGTQSYVELRQMWRVSDNEDASAPVTYLPVKVGINFMIPTSADIDNNDITDIAFRALGAALYEQASESSGDPDGVAALRHGVIRKVGLI